MDRNKKAEMQGMLYAVQEIKSELYVGTQEAWEVIKCMQAVYETPRKIVDCVNGLLGFGEDGYMATPARLSGISEQASKAYHDAEDACGDADAFLLALDNLRFNPENAYYPIAGMVVMPNTIFGIDSVGCLQAPEVVESFGERYREILDAANRAGVGTDAEFGGFFAPYVQEQVEGMAGGIPERASLIERLGWMMAADLSAVDWEHALSDASLRKRETLLIEDCRYERMKTRNIIDRIHSDRVDHRLEYRRQVLCRYLGGVVRHYREEGLPLPSYEDVVRKLEMTVRERQERFGKLKAADAPGVFIHIDEILLKESQFLRHCMGSEKNFARRYLTL